LRLKPRDRICELGSFNGANARAISRRYGCTVYGVDIDHRVIGLAEAFNKTEQTSFLVASAENLPFANESFDKMYAVSVLEHFADCQTALRETYRCLRPGGVLGVTTDSFGLKELWTGSQELHREKYSVHRYFSPQNLKRDIESAGFQIIHLQPILRHWSTGFLFELSLRLNVVKSAAFLLLPLLRYAERVYGSPDAGYMLMACAVKVVEPISKSSPINRRVEP
jgi:SAM-dependent methyltransferase